MSNYLVHYGIPGQQKGVRRYQNEDGTLTPEGKERYYDGTGTRNANSSVPVSQNITNRPNSRIKTVGSGSVTASTGLKVGYGNGSGLSGNARGEGNALAAIEQGKKTGQNVTAYQFTNSPGIIKPSASVEEALKPGQLYDGNTIVEAPTSQNYNIVPYGKPSYFTAQDHIQYAKSQVKKAITDRVTDFFNKLKSVTISSLTQGKDFAEKAVSQVASAIQKLLKKK